MKQPTAARLQEPGDWQLYRNLLHYVYMICIARKPLTTITEGAPDNEIGYDLRGRHIGSGDLYGKDRRAQVVNFLLVELLRTSRGP